MGNCQAIDTATLVIQYPSGKSEKLYWPVSASEIMKTNPGHYVALLISTTLCPNHNNKNNNDNSTKPHHQQQDHNVDNNISTASSSSNNNNNNHSDGNNNANGTVRLTRIKLLRPTDTLALGQVYRLITTQEVMKGLWAKKQAKLKRSVESEGVRVEIVGRDKPRVRGSEHDKVNKQERQRSRISSSSSSSSSSSNSSTTVKPRTWQPSLHSISEATI